MIFYINEMKKKNQIVTDSTNDTIDSNIPFIVEAYWSTFLSYKECYFLFNIRFF